MTKRLVIAALALAVAACGGGDTATENTATENTATENTATEDTTATTTADDETTTTVADESTTSGDDEAADDGITVATTDLGDVIVDGDGFVLYLFTNDTDGTSTCTGSCLDLWPPVPGDAEVGSAVTAEVGTTTRDDGTEQLTLAGQPVYYYAGDTAPGDTSGQGVGGIWFAMNPDGSAVDGGEAAADSGGYDVGGDAGYN